MAERHPKPAVSLVKEIQAEHDAAERDVRSAVEHAVRAGQLLTEAKASLPHGEWGKWLSENFAFSQQWAAGYMRLAKASPGQIESASSIRGALKQLAAPSRKKAGDREEAPADDPVIAAGLQALREFRGVVESEGLDGLSDVDPKRRWEWEAALEAARGAMYEAMSPIERFWLKHKGLLSAEKVDLVRETCEVAGVKAMIEDLSQAEGGGKEKFVWVGYVPIGSEGVENPLTYHPGWAAYCRERLGEGVDFASEDLMPPVDGWPAADEEAS